MEGGRPTTAASLFDHRFYSQVGLFGVKPQTSYRFHFDHRDLGADLSHEANDGCDKVADVCDQGGNCVGRGISYF